VDGTEGPVRAEATPTNTIMQQSSSNLFELIAGGEGGYNSVNRGNAGDTPGGAQSIFGKPLTEMTVGEVVDAQQAGKVFAVGKYQIIPTTMTGFLRQMKISRTAKFNEATQEKFKDYVINFKRPQVGKYIRGESTNRAEAAQELAREFASVGLSYPEAGRTRGESRYSGTAGNRASISPEKVEAALDAARQMGQSNKSNTNSFVPSSSSEKLLPSSSSEDLLPSSSSEKLLPSSSSEDLLPSSSSNRIPSNSNERTIAEISPTPTKKVNPPLPPNSGYSMSPIALPITPPNSGGTRVSSSGAHAGQKTYPSFSATDGSNPTLLSVKSLYNIVE
jgi:hypothetical protein